MPGATEKDTGSEASQGREGEPPNTRVCTRLSKVPLLPHPSWPSGPVTAATQRRFIPGLTWEMLMFCCAHQSGSAMPIIHLLIRGLREPPLPAPASLCLTLRCYPGKLPGANLPSPSTSRRVPLIHTKLGGSCIPSAEGSCWPRPNSLSRSTVQGGSSALHLSSTCLGSLAPLGERFNSKCEEPADWCH